MKQNSILKYIFCLHIVYMKYFLGKKYKGKIELEYDDLFLSDTKPLITPEVCWGLMDMKEIDKKYVNNEITIYLENEDNIVIGFINFSILRKKYIEVHRLCSMREYKGNGKKLILTLIEIAKNLGLEYISLYPALDKDLKVVKFYQDLGFVPDPEGLGLRYIYVLTPSSGGKIKTKKTKSNKTKKTKTNKTKKRKTIRR